jgi:hypothetical protein
MTTQVHNAKLNGTFLGLAAFLSLDQIHPILRTYLFNIANASVQESAQSPILRQFLFVWCRLVDSFGR